MKITGTETLSQLVTNFANAKSDKHLRYNTKGNETTLKIHDGFKFSGLSKKSSEKRDAKHQDALNFVRTAMARQFPGEEGKIDHLLSNIKGGMISVRQLRNLERDMIQPQHNHHEIDISENSNSSRGGKITNEKTIQIERQNSLPDQIDFSKAKNFITHSSGHGGAVELEVGGMKLAVKDHATSNEVMGARLARELGLPAPKTRLLSESESEQLSHTMNEKGLEMPGGKKPVVVMEFVSGTGLEKPNALANQDPKNVARQIGHWLAFDALIHEGDRFGGFGLNFNGISASINSSNFIVGKDGTITGIDQSVGKSSSREPVDNIVEGKHTKYLNMGGALTKYMPDADYEELADHIRAGAEEMFKYIGKNLTPQKLEDLAQGLGVDNESVGKLKERLQRAVEFAG